MPAAEAVQELIAEVGPASVGLAFFSPGDAGAAGVAEYGIRMTPAALGIPQIVYAKAAPPGPQSAEILGLLPYTEYQVDVWARSSDGAVGPESTVRFEVAPAREVAELQIVSVETVALGGSRLRVTHVDLTTSDGRL